MTGLPEHEEIAYSELRVGDVILPWNVEEIVVVGTWTVSAIGPIPLRPELEYQTDRGPGWTRVNLDCRVKIRKRLSADELRATVQGAGTVATDPVR